jgi:hypothetical protein
MNGANGRCDSSKCRSSLKCSKRGNAEFVIERKQKLMNAQSIYEGGNIKVRSVIAPWAINTLYSILDLVDNFTDTRAIAQGNMYNLLEAGDIILRNHHQQAVVAIELGETAHILARIVQALSMSQ